METAASHIHEEIRRWDTIKFDLRRLVNAHPQEAERAGRELAARMQAEIDRLNAKNRHNVEDKLALLEVAKEIVLNREAMLAPSDMAIDPENPPHSFIAIGFDADATIPCWVKRSYEAAGRYDTDVQRIVWSLAGHLENAVNGCIGDYSITKKIDLSKTSAQDAYVHSISALWSQGKRTPEEVRSELDPDSAIVSSATMLWALGHVMLGFLRDDPAELRSIEQWWTIGVAVLVCADADFDPSSVGVVGLPTWEEGAKSKDFWEQFWGARRDILDHCGDYTKNDPEIPEGHPRRFWLLADRACQAISEAASQQAVRIGEVGWLKVSEAATVVNLPTYEITRLANSGDLTTNGETGRSRRIDPASLTQLKLRIAKDETLKRLRRHVR